MLRVLCLIGMLFFAVGLDRSVLAQTPELSPSSEHKEEMEMPESGNFNLQTPTMGGRQFWGDVTFFQGFRIQKNVLTGHYRLLDSADVRRAWGSEEACRQELARIRLDQNLPEMSGKVVIVIHGIIRSSKSFAPLTRKLQAAGDTVIGFDYPSTQAPLAESAKYLEKTIASLEGVDEIDLVVHSMGGLLVRTYLQTAAQPDPRLHRLVMLGVPNHGAKMANLMQNNLLFKWTFGPAGQELIEDPNGLISRLPIPDFDFAIIAGIRGNPDGWNPLIPGEDDGTVGLNSAKLAGAADFIAIPSLHSSMMWNEDVMAATQRFLETGSLRENGHREPIPALDSSPK